MAGKSGIFQAFWASKSGNWPNHERRQSGTARIARIDGNSRMNRWTGFAIFMRASRRILRSGQDAAHRVEWRGSDPAFERTGRQLAL
jgi:hypothetical protein